MSSKGLGVPVVTQTQLVSIVRKHHLTTNVGLTIRTKALLDALSSDKAFDEAYRKEAFHAWQAYTNEELPAIPYLYRYGIRSVNNRVKHYDIANGSSFGIEQLELTADEPIK